MLIAVDAETFAGLHCNEHTITSMVLARGYPIAEVVYPFDAPGARFSRETGLPFIVGATLSSLPVDDVDALYDEVRAFLLSMPTRPVAQQHRALFDWLRDRLGKSVWVERSGGSIDTTNIKDPIIAFVFGQAGLMYNLTLEGSKMQKLEVK